MSDATELLTPTNEHQLAAALCRLTESAKKAAARGDDWIKAVCESFAAFRAENDGQTPAVLHVFAATDFDNAPEVIFGATREAVFTKLINRIGDDDDDKTEGRALLQAGDYEALQEWVEGHTEYFFSSVEVRADVSRMTTARHAADMPPLPAAKPASAARLGRN